MLLLLMRNLMWAAWWPYSTMLLALEKAAQQQAQSIKTARQARPAEPSRAAQDRGPVAAQESSMTNDAFMNAEIPGALRELMKMSIEQARRAFDTFAATSEKTWKSLETSSQSARAGLYALNAKIAEITRANAEANFALAMKLAESRDVNQAMELQSQHVQKQMETFVRQLEEMRDLTAQIIQKANPATSTDVSSARGAPSGSSNVRSGPGSSGYSSYAPSSSFTPGETGRTY